MCMVSILWHAIVRDRIFRPVTSPGFRPSINTQDSSQQEQEQEREGPSDVEVLLRLYVREITTQVLLYTGAYLLCVLPGVVSLFSRVLSQCIVNEFLIATFFPLNGLFTILIYTRPPIRHLRRSHPEYSWLHSFILVLKAGGVNNDSTEIPEQIQLDPRSNLPFGVQSRSYADISSAVEYAGSEKDESSDCSSVLFESELADRYTESGEHWENEKGINVPTDQKSPSKMDRTSQDRIFARAIARTRKMGKESL